LLATTHAAALLATTHATATHAATTHAAATLLLPVDHAAMHREQQVKGKDE